MLPPELPALPPTDSVVSLLGWGLAVAVLGIGAIWRLREKDSRDKDIEFKAELRAQLGKLEGKVEQLEHDKEALQAKYSSEIKRTAQTIALARSALFVRSDTPKVRASSLITGTWSGVK